MAWRSSAVSVKAIPRSAPCSIYKRSLVTINVIKHVKRGLRTGRYGGAVCAKRPEGDSMITISGLEPKKYKITAEGIQELQEQLSELKQKRREVASEMREITSQSTDMGALEDSTLTLIQNKATELDGEIMLLERVLGLAHVITKPTKHDHVQLGSQVTVELDGKAHAYILVGPVEADPEEGKISDESPLGQSLVGKKIGEQVEIVIPGKPTRTAKVTKIT